MQDNRGPRIRFFDDIADLRHAAYIAATLAESDLNISRAIDVRGEEYTFIFQKDGLEALIFAVRDLYERAYNLNKRVDKHFRDEDGSLVIDDKEVRHAPV